VYTVEELIKIFTPDRIRKANPRYDQRKLDYLNGKHIRNLTEKELVEKIFEWAGEYVLKDFVTDQFEEMDEEFVMLRSRIAELLPKWREDVEYFTKALRLVVDRITRLDQVPELMDFLYSKNLSWEDTDWKLERHSKEEYANALRTIKDKLDEAFHGGANLDHDVWETTVRSFADELNWKHGDLFMALRSAVTGKLQSPPLLECIEVLGWKKSKIFIDDAISWLTA
jgi:glutamyl/glutaminyl-tRNA synthetase